MNRYQQYALYKSTKSEWLEEVPDHWSVKRIKNIATHNDEALDEKTDPDFEIEYVDISSVSLVKGIEKSEQMTFEKAPSRARRRVKHGDIIVSTVRTYLKAIAAVNHPSENMIVSTGFAVVRPKNNFHSGYAGYLLQSNGFVGDVVANSVGVSYPAINACDLVRIPAVEPPRAEQEAIARFLDYKTAQIDTLIARNESLLTKLTDKRTAVISHAVTKGLDPSVLMNNSGVEWLGEIPAHWSVCHLKRVANISYGVGGEIDRGLTEGTKLLSLPNITKNGTLLTEEVPLCELSANERESVLLRKGDLLFNWRNGSSDHLGKTALFDLDGEWTHVSFLLRIRFTLTESDPRYFQYMLAGLRMTGFFSSSKAGVNNTFNMFELSNLFVIRPPIEEQRLIAQTLDNISSSIDLQFKKISSAITILKEYRSALITNAVTGKIDIRDFNIPVPAEADALSVGR